MTKHLAEYWSMLTGTVHPDDLAEFQKFSSHDFNLDFPPPAFVGDVVNAPVIILDNNGGYNGEQTKLEFPDGEAHDEFRDLLANPRAVNRKERVISSYYLSRNYTRWLEQGVAALVNGIAYRSVDGNSKDVKAMTKTLPSALRHQHWLRHNLYPLVESGHRFVVVHRWARWNGAHKVFEDSPYAIRSSAPISKDLTTREVEAVQEFLNHV